MGAGSVLTTEVQRRDCATFERDRSLRGGRSWCVLFEMATGSSRARQNAPTCEPIFGAIAAARKYLLEPPEPRQSARRKSLGRSRVLLHGQRPGRGGRPCASTCPLRRCK